MIGKAILTWRVWGTWRIRIHRKEQRQREIATKNGDKWAMRLFLRERYGVKRTRRFRFRKYSRKKKHAFVQYEIIYDYKSFMRASSNCIKTLISRRTLSRTIIHYLCVPYLFLDMYVTICNKLIRTLFCHFPIACIRLRVYPSPCLVACLKWDIQNTVHTKNSQTHLKAKRTANTMSPSFIAFNRKITWH